MLSGNLSYQGKTTTGSAHCATAGFVYAEKRGEDPFFFLLDGIEDPHNLGAIIRTANLAGAHGVIIPKRRAVGLTATVVKASAGAIHYTPVAKVTNLSAEMEKLKEHNRTLFFCFSYFILIFDSKNKFYKSSQTFWNFFNNNRHL